MESGISAHKVAKDTGMPRNAVYRLFKKESSVHNITLENAEKLSAYWRGQNQKKVKVRGNE